MKKIYYNKLIRDKVPNTIKKRGSDLKSRKLKSKEFEKELLKKVYEEASGLLKVVNKKEVISELADVMDVIEEIKKLKKISTGEIKAQQKENQKKKGGFKKRLFLIWSSDDGYKTNEIRYHKRK